MSQTAVFEPAACLVNKNDIQNTLFYVRLKGFFPAANRPASNRKFDSSEAEQRKPIIKKLHSDFAKWKF